MEQTGFVTSKYELMLSSYSTFPNFLFEVPDYKSLTSDAKILYLKLFNLSSLSIKNKWIDSNGHVFVHCTNENVQDFLGCKNQKAGKVFKELEAVDLIMRKHQGLGKPDLIFLKVPYAFIRGKSNAQSHSKECAKYIPGDVKENTTNAEVKSQEMCNSHSNHNNHKNTDLNYTYFNSSSSESSHDKHEPIPYDPMIDDIEDRSLVTEHILEKLEISVIKERNPDNHNLVDIIVSILEDVECSKENTIRCGKEEKPTETVKAQMRKLTSAHIQSIIDSFRKQRMKVINIRAYLLTALFNASLMPSSYCSTQESTQSQNPNVRTDAEKLEAMRLMYAHLQRLDQSDTEK